MNTDQISLLEYAGADRHIPLNPAPRPPSEDANPAPDDTRQPGRAASHYPRKEGDTLTVLVLESNYRLTGAVLFCLCRQKGVVVHLLSRNSASPYRFSRYVRKHHCFSPEKSDAEFLAYTREVAENTQAEVFLPIDVAGMRFTIAHRQQLAAFLRVLPLPESAAYEIATDKSKLGAFMQARGIPAPDTILDVRRNLAAQLEGFRFPVLLKPVDGIGGGGIELFQDAETLRRAVAALPAASNYVIQNCIEGYDIDCNVLYHKGKLVAYSIQKGILPAVSTYAPTEAIEFVRNEAVLDVVHRVMSALNWSGVAHLDLRYDTQARQMKVIEINTRFWLTVVGSAVRATMNFPVLACRAALGQQIPPASFTLGRYIPFANFLRYKLLGRGPNKIPFSWQDTTIRGWLGDPLPKLHHLLHSFSTNT
ncbi:ATP-grasp domain-containing protein [Hymenobacter elongatus]|uniref:ATP-grasp domain-containing protein n=1 Tax=Hymenobacter elongatus TaxID=877208 RepID=A0A4Z0PPD2_9BACT|nr:ATP-grasp domain-containing protein [Hymenobacter elongatus]TGE17333.1 ATP-grasp domain-containing protein [Hymenobacter elongatus]